MADRIIVIKNSFKTTKEFFFEIIKKVEELFEQGFKRIEGVHDLKAGVCHLHAFFEKEKNLLKSNDFKKILNRIKELQQFNSKTIQEQDFSKIKILPEEFDSNELFDYKTRVHIGNGLFNVLDNEGNIILFDSQDFSPIGVIKNKEKEIKFF
jgi:hypothetical protein